MEDLKNVSVLSYAVLTVLKSFKLHWFKMASQHHNSFPAILKAISLQQNPTSHKRRKAEIYKILEICSTKSTLCNYFCYGFRRKRLTAVSDLNQHQKNTAEKNGAAKLEVYISYYNCR